MIGSVLSDFFFVIVSGFIALASGAFGAVFVSVYAHKFGLLDRPCERSSHVKVTPKGGGIGILATFVGLVMWLKLPVWFWLPAMAVSVVSLLGDRAHLSQKLRLAIQFVCAGLLVSGFYLAGPEHAPCSWPLLAVLCAGLSVYIVGTANFYNFMDGINGIAGLTGSLAFGALAFYGTYISPGGSNFLPMVSLCIAAACIGFLPFNFPKARVFMGDVGSVLLGFLFAGAVVMLSDSILDFVCLNSFLFMFYADELSTMIVRLLNRENLLQAHRRHIYQILANQRGMPHWKVSGLYVLAQAIIDITVLLVRPYGLSFVCICLLAWILGFAWFANYVRQFEKGCSVTRTPLREAAPVSGL